MNKKAVLTAFVSAFLLSAMFGALSIIQVATAAEEVEIKYDDGTYDEVSYAWARIGCMLAVRFTPPYAPCQLITARYYIANNPADFKVRVFDSDRKAYPVEKMAYPTSTGWFSVDLSAENVIVEGDFYVALEYTNDRSEPDLGADMDDPDDRSWFVSEQWESQSDYARKAGWPEGETDFMLRAVIKPADTDADTDGDGLYVLIGLIAGGVIAVAVVAFLLLRRRKGVRPVPPAPTEVAP